MQYPQVYRGQEAIGAEVRRSLVTEAFLALDAEIDALAKQCEILEMRLQPVLIPSAPRQEMEDKANVHQTPVVPLANDIRLRRDRINTLARHLMDMHERIGV